MRVAPVRVSPGRQCLDQIYDLRHQARVVVGSQDGVTPPQSRPEAADALQAARAYVREYAAQTRSGMLSAVDTAGLPRLVEQMKTLTGQLRAVDRNLIYTTMMAVPPMDLDPGRPGFGERDLGTFLQLMMNDPRYPEGVREQAIKTRRSYEDCLVSQWCSGDKKALRRATGASLKMDWKPEAGPASAFAQDSGWRELQDYVFEKAQPLPRWRGLGGWFSEYKRYISPYQDAQCGYNPSCSAYMKNALAEHGLWGGAQRGMLRFMSCDGGAVCGCPHVPERLLQPAVASPSTWAGRVAAFGARLTGHALGAVAGGALGLVAGLTVGAWMGAQPSGYQPYAVEDEATAAGWEKLRNTLGSGPASPARGAAAGLVGGALLGAHFGGLWLQNRTREALGQLPPS